MSKDIRQTDLFCKLILPAVLLGVIAISQAQAYELIDLGINVQPKAINNLGVIVGASNTDQYPASAFVWSSEGGIDLINGAISANAVNDNGQIGGSTIDGAFIVDGNYRDWSDYGAFGINQSGVVAGYKVGSNQYQPRSLPYNPAIFDGKKWKVFDIAKLYPRGTRQGVYADRFILNAINTGGYSVGYKYRYGLSGSAAILISTNASVNSGSDVVYLPVPNGGRAVDINNSNVVVGTAAGDSSAGEYAFIYDYDGNALINLGTLPSNGPGSEPGLTSAAYDINDLNQVVGNSWLVTTNTSVYDPATYHAFLWESGQMTDLNDLVVLPVGWILTRATAINESGDIVGVALVDGVEHGFLLNDGSISEPPSGQNQPPVVVAGADLTVGKVPLLVQFDSADSTDPEAGNLIFSWDFKDGSFSTEANPLHEFTTPGIYSVILTAADEKGATATDIIKITVKNGKRK